MKPILFLDIDGVLNSVDWGRRWKELPHNPKFGQLMEWERDAETSMDPDAVARLNKIVNLTECLVVLSSSWRKLYPLSLITRMLRYRGFEHRLFACTPAIHVWGQRTPRGSEIDWWLKQLETWSKLAIVDDDSDMEPYLDRLVQTNGEVGLTDENVERLIALLKE